MEYDLNGNISNLKRSAQSQQGASAFNIDDLGYIYTGNRLTSVTDSSTDYRGYPDTSGNTISYDLNGNMKDHKDKGILQIDYNFLNLPKYIKFSDFASYDRSNKVYVNTNYLYRADGVKMRKVHNYKDPSYAYALGTRTTDYLDGFQYEYDWTPLSGIPTNDFQLKFVPTSEGYFDFEKNKYIYNYTDHLGNIRLSYFNNGSGAEVLEENNYYPFGMKHEGYNTSFNFGSSYQYKYNGKELQTESGMYDYGARFYMADIGRWGVVDPLAEKNRRFTPYNYAVNNPIMFIDPDGRNADVWELNSDNGNLTKIEENDKVDELYIVDNKGNRKTDSAGNQVKFRMERDEQIEERITSSDSVIYTPRVDGKRVETTKEIPFEIFSFENQNNAKSFFEFLEKNSNAGNEFDLLQYTQNGQDKGMVGRTLQFSFLPRFEKDGTFGAFLPTVSLGYYSNMLKTTSGISLMKSEFYHSHPNEGINPIPSPADINSGQNDTIPIPKMGVYSGGVYNLYKK